MADAAFMFLLQNLKQTFSNTLKQKCGSVDYMREQLEYLNHDMVQMETLVRNSERKRDASERIKIFTRNVIDTIYRADDVMADLTVAIDPRTPLRLKGSDREIHAEIREIKDKIEHLSRISRAFDFSQGEISSAERSSRQTYGHQIEEHFVGKEEDINLLWSRLELGSNCRAVFICGMGGLGKTALAKKVYEHLRFVFSGFAWVYVSMEFDRRRVLLDLYTQLNSHDNGEFVVSEMGDIELVKRIREIQQSERCLVVLDEIWSGDVWEMIRDAFPSSGESGSKILITTRVAQVVEAFEIGAENRYVHKLRRLTEDEGCKLFQKMVLLRDVPDFEANKILMEMAKKTVKFCEGLPLAIISFLRFMATKHTLEEWMVVNRSLGSFVRKSQENGGKEGTLQLLSSSYDNLSRQLRHCFLYLGHSREHSLIDTEKLYLLWEAEGLVFLKDVAESYLNEMAERSMVEVHEEEEVPIIGRFKSCQLNKLMRDLCLLKNKEQGFLKVVDFEHGPQQQVPNSFSSSSTSGNEAYRLAINLDKYENGYNFPLEDNEKKHIRSLLFSSAKEGIGIVWPSKLSSLVDFKYLRTLDFEGFNFQVTKLPRGIGKLLHLKYLSFRGCVLPELPSSVGNLTCLLVLDLLVRPLSKITIPNVLWKLKKLRHLYFPVLFSTRDGGKLRLEGLTELETLTNFNPGVMNLEDLFKLSKLRYLSLNMSGNVEEIESITKRMIINSGGHILRTSLEISNFDCYTEERHSVLRRLLASHSLIVLSMEGHMRRLPVYNKISQNLAKIVLIGTELIEDPMRTLEKLTNLRVLVLDDDAFIGEEMICSEDGFGELRRLELLNLQKLEKWVVEDGAMPQLSNLAIVNCGKLKMLPEELGFVGRLRGMRISRVHKEFKDNLQTVRTMMMKQDTYKVLHVRPIISIDDIDLEQ